MESSANLRQMLIFCNIGLLTALLLPMIYLLRKFRSIARLLEELQLQIPEGKGEIRAQVWVNNDQERQRLWKIFPSKEIGILVLGSDKVSLYSINFNGERTTHHYERSNLKAEWLGNQTMKDANLQWFALCENESRTYVSAYTGAIALPSRQQTAEIYRNIAGQHVQFQGAKEFALEKNPASLTTLIILACVIVYAVADGIFINPLEVVGYPKNIIIFTVFPVAAICLLATAIYSFMIRFSVPARETLVLTMLCVSSLILATLPLLQRIDTAITTKPMQTYDYHMVKEGIFEPDNKGLPKLKFKLRCDYWKQFGENHKFQFMLREGGLGMWQYDGRLLDKDIETYMKNNPPQRK